MMTPTPPLNSSLFCSPCAPTFAASSSSSSPSSSVNYAQTLQPTIRVSLSSVVILVLWARYTTRTNNTSSTKNNSSDDTTAAIRILLLRGILAWMILTTITLFWTCPPIPQPQWYHQLADQRPCLFFSGCCCRRRHGERGGRLISIPNGNDVLSNIPFAVVSILGMLQLYYDYDYFPTITTTTTTTTSMIVLADPASERPLWTAYFLGVGLVSIGSSYYHYQPNNARLAWDRLPMTIAFCSLVAIVLHETVMDVSIAMLLTLLLIGASTVLYWHMVNDLRPYALVQAFSLALIPLCYFLGSSSGSRFYQDDTVVWHYMVALGFYMLAKVAEDKDYEIYVRTKHRFSGHTLKHILSSVAAGWATVILSCRSPKE